MARYNEILVGRFARGVQKLFGIKGSPPTPQLSGDIQIVHQLHRGVDAFYLEGWELFFTEGFNPAVVGQNTAVRIRNPVGSNIIAVIHFMTAWINPGGTTAYAIGVNSADLAGGAPNQQNFDPRTRSKSALSLSVGNNVTDPGSVFLEWNNEPVTAQGTPSRFLLPTPNVEIPLLPSMALQIRTGSPGTNTSLTFAVWWRERYLEESERS